MGAYAGRRRRGRRRKDRAQRQLESTLSAPIERITEESELFSQLHANRYRFIAYFGEAASSAFEQVRSVHAEVIVAAGELVRDSSDLAGDGEARREIWEGAIGWGQRKDDRIPARLDNAVRQIEQICLPLIQGGHGTQS